MLNYYHTKEKVSKKKRNKQQKCHHMIHTPLIIFIILPKFHTKMIRGPSPNPPFSSPHKIQTSPMKIGSLTLIHTQIPLSD
jgi:hypothetical protein